MAMQLQLFLLTALLLAAAQAVLGLAGYLLRGLPWVGLLCTLLLLWLIGRIGKVLRQEIARASRRGVPVVPMASACFVAVLWQVPGLLALPLWAPAWEWSVWQGAVLPLPALLSGFLGSPVPVLPWVWGAYGVEILLFVWVAGRPYSSRRVRRETSQLARAAGEMEWAPARRYTGKQKRRPDVKGDGAE